MKLQTQQDIEISNVRPNLRPNMNIKLRYFLIAVINNFLVVLAMLM